jgi:ribulose-phosphate 3-epimerase
MGIAEIGYQGQQFDERVVAKIMKLRNMSPDIIISVDGGVNFETAPILIHAGANRLVSGSAIFKSEDINSTIKKLQTVRGNV